MKKTLITRTVLAVFFTAMSLGACANRDEAQGQINDINKTADASLAEIRRAPSSPSALTEEDTPWFGNTSIPAQAGDTLPATVEGQDSLVITFERPLTLEELAARIQSVTNIRAIVSANPTVANDPTQTNAVAASGVRTFLPADGTEVTGGRVVWQGKLSSLMDQIADRFDADWNYSNGTLHLSQQIVRTYMLHALAGSTDVGGSVKTSSAGDAGLPQQSVDSSSKLQLWDEIQKTIDTIIVGRARASYSPGTGTITLAGSPSAVKAAEDYLRMQNKLRLRRISIEARVLSVLLNKEYVNNVDLDIVIRDAFNNQPFVFSNQAPTTGQGRTIVSGLLRQIPTGLGTGGSTQLAINALSAVSDRVSVEYSASLVTLSDQPAPLQVATKQAYVARVTGVASQNNTSTTLEPGTIDLGLSMNILPRVIEQDRIMLRIALGITDLVDLRQFTSGTSSVQLPIVDSTGFLQNAVLQSGETLVLAGFERKGGDNLKQGIGDESFWFLGGGESYSKRREVRVLLLTAHLLPEDPITTLQK